MKGLLREGLIGGRCICIAAMTLLAVDWAMGGAIASGRVHAHQMQPPPPPPPPPSGPTQAELEAYSKARLATVKTALEGQRTLEAGIEEREVSVRKPGTNGSSEQEFESRPMRVWETPAGMELMAWEGNYMPDIYRPVEGGPYTLGYRMQMSGLAAWVPPTLFSSGADLGSSTEALVPAGMGAMPTGWQGKGRATLQGMVDLMTGSPLIKRTDLELPVGQSVFRFNRTRSSMHGTSFSTLGSIDNKGVFDATDRMWDWAGTGWMISENPILLIDDGRPDEVGSGARTTWLVLDAHRSIPFQWIEDLNRYESPARFGAKLTFTETFDAARQKADGKRGPRWPMTSESTHGRTVSSVSGWTQVPREWKVSLYGGALTYTFTLIPGNQIKQQWDPRIWLNPNLPESVLLDSTMHDRPFLAEDFDDESGSGGATGGNQHIYVWANAMNASAFTGSFVSPQPGYGVPHLAILTKIEGECGTSIDLHYAKVRQRPMDWDQTTDLYEMHQDALSVGQLKYLTIRMSPTARDAKGGDHPKQDEIVWTAVYSHRHFTGVHSEVAGDNIPFTGLWNDLRKYPWFMGVEGVGERDEDWWRRTMQGYSAIDRIYVYEGELPQEVLAHEMVTSAIEPEDVSEADDRAKLNEPLERFATKHGLGGQLEKLRAWRYAIRHDYNKPGDVPVSTGSRAPGDFDGELGLPLVYPSPIDGLWPWWEPSGLGIQPQPARGPVGPPMLVMTSVFEQPAVSQGGVVTGEMERRDRSVVIYDLPGWYEFEGPIGVISSRPQADRRGAWELPWVTAILDETDIDRVLRAKWMPNGDEGVPDGEHDLVGSLAELAYQRRTSGLLAKQVFSEERREEIVRLASMQFASSLEETWTTTAGSELAKRYSPSMESLWTFTQRFGQYVRTGEGSPGTAGIDGRAIWDGHVATVGDISIGGDGQQTSVQVGEGSEDRNVKASNRGFHARIHRYVLAPQSGNPEFQHVYRQRAEGDSHLEDGPPLASVFLHPFRWHAFRTLNTTNDPHTQPPDGAVLRAPRYIVVVDEFEDRASMRSGVLAFTPRRGQSGSSDEPVGGEGYSSVGDGGLKKGMIARTVYELNPWGYVLRQRRWDFRDGQATQTVQGIGEEYIYKTIQELLDPATVSQAQAMAAVPEGTDPAFWPVPSVEGLLNQIVLAEKRSVGWSVADATQPTGNSPEGLTQGLIETVKYELALPSGAGTDEISAQLEKFGWSERLRQKSSGFRRGTDGEVFYQTQRFYDPVRLNEVIAEVRFNTPRTESELLASPPSDAQVLSNEALALGYQVTLHRFKVMPGQPQDNPASHLVWRQRIDPPVRQSPQGPWYFPTERRYLTSDHQNPYTVTALLQNPFEGPTASDVDEMVVWTVQYVNGWGQPDVTIMDSWIGSSLAGQDRERILTFEDSESQGGGGVFVGYPSWDTVEIEGAAHNVEPWPRRPGRWGAATPANRITKHLYNGEDHQLTDRIEKGRRYALRVVKDEGDPEIEGDEVTYEFEFPVLRALQGSRNAQDHQMYEVLEPVRIRKRSGRSVWGALESEETVRFTTPVSLQFTSATRPVEAMPLSPGAGTEPPISSAGRYVAITRREFGLDVHGRPVAMNQLEPTRMPNGSVVLMRSGGADVYDLGEVIRRWEYGGNVQRWTRDYLGLRYRRYEGTTDYFWGNEGRETDGTTNVPHPFDGGFVGYDMVLKERTEYGTSITDIWQPVREFRYLTDHRDSWAHASSGVSGGSVAATGGYHNPVPAGVVHDAYLTEHRYDWRGRRVRSDLFDRPGTAGGSAASNQDRLRRRTTLRYLDGAGREYMTAEFGELMPATLPGATDPTNAPVTGSQARPQDVLALSPRPVSLVERLFDAGDRVVETRNWRVDGVWSPQRYTATFSFFGPGGEIFTHSGEGAARRTGYDPLGRARTTTSVVNRGTGAWTWELERTDTTFDERDNPIIEIRYERVLDQGETLDASNAVSRVIHRWFDPADRKIAEVDHGTGETQGGLTMFVNRGGDIPIRSEEFAVDPSRWWVRTQRWRYNEAGQLIESIDPDGVITRFEYVGSRLISTSVNTSSAGVAQDHEQRTQEQSYYHGKLVSQRLRGEFGELQPNPGASPHMASSSVYGAAVVDGNFVIRSWDWTKVRYMGRLGAVNQVAAHEPGEATREFEFRYDFLGRVAERIAADGIVMRYRYTSEDELSSIEVGRYQGTTFVPGYGSQLIAQDTIGFVEYMTTVAAGAHGAPLKTRTATARVGRLAADGSPGRVISQVVQQFDGEGRLISEQQAIGTVVTANTPRIDYVRSAERALPGNQGLATQLLTEMIYPQIREYQRRRVVLSYGLAGSIDEELGRVTAIGTRLSAAGTVLPLANHEFGGMDRRVRTVLGGLQHGVEKSIRRPAIGADSSTGLGYEGVDGFGRERVASYTRVSANPNVIGEELLRLEYAFDRRNRITWQSVNFGNAASSGERAWNRGYRYDKLGRLVEAAIGDVRRSANSEVSPWTVGSGQLARRDRWHLDVADNWSLTDPELNQGAVGNVALPGGRVVTTWGQGKAAGGFMAAFRQAHLASGDLAMLRVGLDGTVDPPGGNGGTLEFGLSEAVQRDAAGRVESDGRQFYIYDAWGRLTQVSEADVDTTAPAGVIRWKPGKLIRHFMYDAYGRMIRVQRRSQGVEEDPTLELVSSERMYYDGVRRVMEVVSAPVLSKLASDGLEVPDVIEAESGDEPDDKTANATFEGWQLTSNELEVAVEYVWDVEGPVDTLIAYFGGTGHASAYGAGHDQRHESWFVIQDKTGDPVAVLSGPMGGTNASGQVTQPMRIAWRGVLCNTGGVVMAVDHESYMPPLRIGHKGLHVERLDGPAYVFNMQYWPDRLIQGTGRTSASAIGVRTGGSTTQPTSWTPHPRDQSADMLILMRNRAMIASHGRFLQPDPNATGLPVMGDLSFGGSALSPPRPEVELATWTTDGLNVLAYCGGDAVNRGDPTGLFAGLLGPTSMFDLYTDHMVNTLEWGNSARNSINMLVERYAGTQMALMQWLMTPNAPDHWFQMITGINFGSDGAPAADPLEQVRASGDEQALAEQLALRRSMGGNVAGVMRRSVDRMLDWMQPGASMIGKALRYHGKWKHNNSIMIATFGLLGRNKGIAAHTIRHNMPLRGPSGKVVSNIRPDVQAFDPTTNTLHIIEVVDTSPPSARRLQDIKNALQSAGWAIPPLRIDYQVKPVSRYFE